jgi:hypothetical protein
MGGHGGPPLQLLPRIGLALALLGLVLFFILGSQSGPVIPQSALPCVAAVLAFWG